MGAPWHLREEKIAQQVAGFEGGGKQTRDSSLSVRRACTLGGLLRGVKQMDGGLVFNVGVMCRMIVKCRFYVLCEDLETYQEYGCDDEQ